MSNTSQKYLYIKTYGCQMNVYDSEKMADLLKPLGYALTDTPENGDIVILNTCHIREKAKQKVLSDLGRLNQTRLARMEKGQEMIIAVGGCVAQAEGDELIKQAPYISMVFGPQTYHRLPEMIAKITRARGETLHIVDTDFPVESKFDHLPSAAHTKVSQFVTIQEGCDKFCTFCCVPYTRGAEVSRPVADIVEEVKRLAALGAKEITLLGQNVNAYHGMSPHGKEQGLGALLHTLAKIDGIARLRYTTSHPRDVDDALIEAHRDIPAVMPYIHLPVQSGSNAMLEGMNRKHTVAEYLSIIEKLRRARPDIAFSSDFIVGFPGESERDHQDTLTLVREVTFAQAYSFKYSIRPGTPAGIHTLQVEESIKDRRLQELQTLLVAQQIAFNESCIGQTIPVLFDRDGRKEGQLIGKSPYMQSVYAEAPIRHKNNISNVVIEKATQNSLSGPLETVEHVAA